MKKIETKVIVIAVIAVVLLLLGVGKILFSRPNVFSKGDAENHYSVSSKKKKEENYTNDKLKKAHCLGAICIENVQFYYSDNKGRIECIVTNHSSEKVSGLVKLVFENQYLVISYQDLEPNQKLETAASYEGMQIQSKEDYVLEELTEEEKSAIIYK